MKMIELGSEFYVGSTPMTGGGVSSLLPAHMDTRFALCGRTALELVLRDAVKQWRIRSAYLPSYCCRTMIEPFISKGIDVFFYDVFFAADGIVCDFDDRNGHDLVFMMDYFGFLNTETVRRAKEQKNRGKCVIYDATHSLFCTSVDYSCCDYVFGSFRKWFDVNAGFCSKHGVWLTFPKLIENLSYSATRNHAFQEKQAYISGEAVDKNRFLQAFGHAEESLETDYLGYGPDTVSLHKLCSVDVDFVRSRRRENAAWLIRTIEELCSAHLRSPFHFVGESECPLFVPVEVVSEYRMPLRKALIAENIYLPIHWPLSSLHRVNDSSCGIYATELSFLCDQRYCPEQLEKMTDITTDFFESRNIL